LAFGGTAAVFFGMASIASTTKRDTGGLGNFLAIAHRLMLAVVANAFFAT